MQLLELGGGYGGASTAAVDAQLLTQSVRRELVPRRG